MSVLATPKEYAATWVQHIQFQERFTSSFPDYVERVLGYTNVYELLKLKDIALSIIFYIIVPSYFPRNPFKRTWSRSNMDVTYQFLFDVMSLFDLHNLADGFVSTFQFIFKIHKMIDSDNLFQILTSFDEFVKNESVKAFLRQKSQWMEVLYNAVQMKEEAYFTDLPKETQELITSLVNTLGNYLTMSQCGDEVCPDVPSIPDIKAAPQTVDFTLPSSVALALPKGTLTTSTIQNGDTSYLSSVTKQGTLAISSSTIMEINIHNNSGNEQSSNRRETVEKSRKRPLSDDVEIVQIKSPKPPNMSIWRTSQALRPIIPPNPSMYSSYPLVWNEILTNSISVLSNREALNFRKESNPFYSKANYFLLNKMQFKEFIFEQFLWTFLSALSDEDPIPYKEMNADPKLVRMTFDSNLPIKNALSFVFIVNPLQLDDYIFATGSRTEEKYLIRKRSRMHTSQDKIDLQSWKLYSLLPLDFKKVNQKCISSPKYSDLIESIFKAETNYKRSSSSTEANRILDITSVCEARLSIVGGYPGTGKSRFALDAVLKLLSKPKSSTKQVMILYPNRESMHASLSEIQNLKSHFNLESDRDFVILDDASQQQPERLSKYILDAENLNDIGILTKKNELEEEKKRLHMVRSKDYSSNDDLILSQSNPGTLYMPLRDERVIKENIIKIEQSLHDRKRECVRLTISKARLIIACMNYWDFSQYPWEAENLSSIVVDDAHLIPEFDVLATIGGQTNKLILIGNNSNIYRLPNFDNVSTSAHYSMLHRLQDHGLPSYALRHSLLMNKRIWDLFGFFFQNEDESPTFESKAYKAKSWDKFVVIDFPVHEEKEQLGLLAGSIIGKIKSCYPDFKVRLCASPDRFERKIPLSPSSSETILSKSNHSVCDVYLHVHFPVQQRETFGFKLRSDFYDPIQSQRFLSKTLCAREAAFVICDCTRAMLDPFWAQIIDIAKDNKLYYHHSRMSDFLAMMK